MSRPKLFRVGLLAVALTAALVVAGSSRTAEAGLRHAAHHGGHCCEPNCCEPCPPPVKYCVTVCHPCTGCPVEIELCVPHCCDGEPCVTHRRTIIGCGATTFEWCCGYRAVVRFKKCGDYTVAYR